MFYHNCSNTRTAPQPVRLAIAPADGLTTIIFSLPKPLACLAGLLLVLPAAFAAPGFTEVRTAYVESDATLLARDGQPLQTLRLDKQVRRLPWMRLEEVSPTFLHALLVSEDRRFYEHSGVDWSALAISAWRNLWNTKTRGASTLSMQLVGLLDEEDKRRGRRSLLEKLNQAAAALWLEQHWKKDEILEAYLNLVTFRGELQGIAAMSRGLFGKWPDGLNEREAALAVALLRGPNAAPATVAGRACAVLKVMQRNDCNGLDGQARLALTGSLRTSWLGRERSPDLAPHLARKLLRQPGERLRSTLDANLQKVAASALQRHLRELSRQNAEDGALLALDNQSGEVLAWVGSSGSLSEAPEVDGVVALRQAGSTLKPFLYGLAFEQRRLTAASLLDDSPLSLPTDAGAYNPQNYTAQYRGWVSARMALGGSLNVPAVRTLVRVSPESFAERLRSLGLSSIREPGDYYGYSLALGSADLSLLALANAYRSLANGGQWSPLKAGPLPPCQEGGCAGVFSGAPHRAAAETASFIVSDILADRSARAATFGLESWLATPYWSAAKTGTSKDMRDNWCLGFSRRYTVAVWVGNASGASMRDVSGVSGAAPVWREVMDWLESRQQGKSPPPAAPAGLVQQKIRFEPTERLKEPERQEWFLTGTQTQVVRLAENRSLTHITNPGDGAILALDPDIPPDRQQVALRLSGQADPGWHWQMDEITLGPARSPTLWRPSPGKHRLTLLDGERQAVESIHFEVRALRGTASGKR